MLFFSYRFFFRLLDQIGQGTRCQKSSSLIPSLSQQALKWIVLLLIKLFHICFIFMTIEKSFRFFINTKQYLKIRLVTNFIFVAGLKIKL